MPESISKIVIVVSNLEYGGAQRQIVELANNLDPNTFELHIVSLSDFIPLADDLTIPSRNIHIIKKYWKYDLTVLVRLALKLRSLGASLVHGFLYDAEIAARVAGFLSGTPTVLGSERNCNYLIKKNQMFFYNLTKDWQHASVANSHAGAEFNQRMLGYGRSHYRVVHNGVNTQRFRPGDGGALRKKLGISEDVIVVGLFGSFKEQKNHRLFFRVASDLVQKNDVCQFMLVGDQLYDGMHGSDQYKAELDKLIDELGIRGKCLFVGNQIRVEEYYRACDLTVLPSLHEGMPNVVLESLASGVPVIATDVSDNHLLIRDRKVGLLVPSDDPVRLRVAMSTLIEDADLRRLYGRNAVQWIREHFSAQIMAEKMGDVYWSLISQAKSSNNGDKIRQSETQ